MEIARTRGDQTKMHETAQHLYGQWLEARSREFFARPAQESSARDDSPQLQSRQDGALQKADRIRESRWISMWGGSSTRFVAEASNCGFDQHAVRLTGSRHCWGWRPEVTRGATAPAGRCPTPRGAGHRPALSRKRQIAASPNAPACSTDGRHCWGWRAE